LRSWRFSAGAGAAGRRKPSFSTHLWRHCRHRWVEKERGSLEGKALQTSQLRNSYKYVARAPSGPRSGPEGARATSRLKCCIGNDMRYAASVLVLLLVALQIPQAALAHNGPPRVELGAERIMPGVALEVRGVNIAPEQPVRLTLVG